VQFGTDRNGIDCTNLCQLVYKENNLSPSEWTDGKPVDKEWFLKSPYRLLFFLKRNFIRVEKLEMLTPGDIIYMSIQGEGHVSIFVGHGRFLSIMPPKNIMWGGLSFIDRLLFYSSENVAYFKRKVGELQ
jgi:cell wall-associated NlpC family hydrolase